MILFDLFCSNKHVFEAWFASDKQYEKQKKNKLINCPICDDKNIKKSLMAPNINTKGLLNKKTNNVMNKDDTNKIYKEVKKLKNIVEKNTIDVGDNFAEEARKIHYGEEKPKAIRGKTTSKEAKELLEEGVPFASLPWTNKEDA